ncbi:MAG: hypothetical protein KKE05_06240 [Nanoarchaeota archaeon]|nr:hypothetical protein [Nanoarchaeota archaeon]
MNRYQLRRYLETAAVEKTKIENETLSSALVSLFDMVESLETRVGDLELEVKKHEK